MTTEDSFLVLVHYKGTIKKKTRSRINDKDPLSIFTRSSMSLVDFHNTVLQKFSLHEMKWIEKLYYRIPISIF
ncbi:hypothetical protein Ahy_A08g040141 [Arachis hypogaea]|uniref:Uncharacterized protein n=1 Tax=Arachis hypogaea TaxID=3818 RepID=A0A445BYD6_ARAHY|nr:hypothetical protein Ahy_A08g040141 [Arachis hypogaea]